MQPAVHTPTAAARYALLQAELPGGDLTAIGVLLEDTVGGAVYMRLRRDWELVAEDDDDRELLSELASDLAAKAREMGAEAFFRFLEDSLSNTLRVTGRQATAIDMADREGFERALNRLYNRHVESNVIPFRTHLPRYSLRVAAGKFLENEEVTEERWIEAPADLRLSKDMFVAQIQGHSMEPLIPDGALCVFRAGVTGSRKGRLVLVESLETHGNNRYSVKRYASQKISAEDAENWRHSRITLESLNPSFPSWDLEEDEEKYRILAEFVRVLE